MTKPNPWDYDYAGRLQLRPTYNPDPFHTANMARAAVVLAGFRCQVCGDGRYTVEAHHRDYDNFGKEQLSDFCVLCPKHHAQYHSELNAEKRKRRAALEGGLQVSADPGQQPRFRPKGRRTL